MRPDRHSRSAWPARARRAGLAVAVLGAAALSGLAAPAASSAERDAGRHVPACRGADLTVTPGRGVAGLGHVGQAIEFHNRSSATCALWGYPGVALLNAKGAVAMVARWTPNGYLGGEPTSSTRYGVVVLRPGAVAAALVEGTDSPPNGSATPCAVYRAAIVIAPNTTRRVRVAVDLSGCSRLDVHPVILGATGVAPEP